MHAHIKSALEGSRQRARRSTLINVNILTITNECVDAKCESTTSREGSKIKILMYAPPANRSKLKLNRCERDEQFTREPNHYIITSVYMCVFVPSAFQISPHRIRTFRHFSFNTSTQLYKFINKFQHCLLTKKISAREVMVKTFALITYFHDGIKIFNLY